MSRVDGIGIEFGDLSEFSSTSGAAVNTSIVRSGAYSLELAANGNFAKRTFSALGEVWARIYFWYPTGGRAASGVGLGFDNSGTRTATITWAADHKLSVVAEGGTIQTTSNALVQNAWNEIKLRYKKGTGANAEAEVILNGTSTLSNNGTRTLDANGCLLERGSGDAALPSVIYDDLSIDNAAFPGAGKIVGVLPNATGDENDFSNDWTYVNDGSDATFRDAPASGTTPRFLENIANIPAADSVAFAKVRVRAKRTAGTGRSQHVRYKINTTTETGPDLNLTTSFANYQYIPTAQPATESDANSIQAGMEQSLGGGEITSCAEVKVSVEYVESSSANYTIAGAITVSLTVAATMLRNIHPALAGAVTVSVTPAAAMVYNRHANIQGQTTVNVLPAAVMTYNFVRELAGNITVGVVPAAALAYNRNASIIGNITVGIVPAAAMAFTQTNAIVGSILVTVTPAATLDYTRNAAIGGDITVALTPAALLSYTRNASIVGDILVQIIPAAAMLFQSSTIAVKPTTVAVSDRLLGGAGVSDSRTSGASLTETRRGNVVTRIN